jgi:hypothetical protein
VRKVAETQYDAVCIELGYCTKRSDLESVRQTIKEAGATEKLNYLNRLKNGSKEAEQWVSAFLINDAVSKDFFSECDLAAMAAMATGKSVWSVEPYEPIAPASQRLIKRMTKFNSDVRGPLVTRNLKQVEREYESKAVPSVLHVTHNGDKNVIESLLKTKQEEFDIIIEEALRKAGYYLDITNGKEPDKAHMLIL